ncbi:MAG: ParB/RepB/Spo0J family partition protein [Eubacterium sp.]|nr:ParB/RepB/Spo0J family partition protein [Eubacterium sp.]
MVWDGKTLCEIVKEHFYRMFANEIEKASEMNNKDFADLLKKKHNNSGHSNPDKCSYIHANSRGIEIRFRDCADKAVIDELDSDKSLTISWSMAARHIRAWEQEKKCAERAEKAHKIFGMTHSNENNDKEVKTMAAPNFDFKGFISESNQLKKVPLDMLVAYRNHKFKLYEGERLDDMVNSVRENGVLTPIIVRAIEDGEKYEILAGHNRTNAARLAGLTSIPAVVKENLTDDEAEMYVVETNVMQRGFDDLSITERAAVISARHSAMFDEDKRRAIERELALLNGEEVEDDDKKSKLAAVGENYGLSKDSVARLVRINKLIEELKPFVDDGAIAIRAAVNLSYLTQDEQSRVAELMDLGMDMKKAVLLRELSKQGKLNERAIQDIMYRGELNDGSGAVKRKPIKVKISADISEKYFAPEWDEKKVQEIVDLALEQYFANGE